MNERKSSISYSVAKAWLLWACESEYIILTCTHAYTQRIGHAHIDTHAHPYERARTFLAISHQYNRERIRTLCMNVDACKIADVLYPSPVMSMYASVRWVNESVCLKNFWYIENGMLAATSAMDFDEMARCVHLSIDTQCVIFCVSILRLRLYYCTTTYWCTSNGKKKGIEEEKYVSVCKHSFARACVCGLEWMCERWYAV